MHNIVDAQGLAYESQYPTHEIHINSECTSIQGQFPPFNTPISNWVSAPDKIHLRSILPILSWICHNIAYGKKAEI